MIKNCPPISLSFLFLFVFNLLFHFSNDERFCWMEVITKGKTLVWRKLSLKKRQSWSHAYDFISMQTVLESSLWCFLVFENLLTITLFTKHTSNALVREHIFTHPVAWCWVWHARITVPSYEQQWTWPVDWDNPLNFSSLKTLVYISIRSQAKFIWSCQSTDDIAWS